MTDDDKPYAWVKAAAVVVGVLALSCVAFVMFGAAFAVIVWMVRRAW